MKHVQNMLCLAAFVLALVGCSDDGPPRYQVHGRVTYDGRPVPAGRVIFEPDAAAGGKGPAGYADIANGSYRTLSDKGVVGGPHQIRVICLSGTAEGELAEGRMLCPEYRETVDLPTDNAEHNIDIPSSLSWQR
ncbi:MAG: hypothetical protein WEA31_04155 [Pirellulales bacterium]